VRDDIAAGDRTHGSPSLVTAAQRFALLVFGQFRVAAEIDSRAFVRSRARADQYNYDSFGVVKESAIPTFDVVAREPSTLSYGGVRMRIWK
jgi:hypothetical protein